MRKSLLILLLASSAPAFAQDRDERRAARAEAREERREAREERREARESGPRAEAVAVGRADRRDVEAIREVREEQRQQRHDERADRAAAPPRIEERSVEHDSVREWRREQREQHRAARAGAPGSRPPRVRVAPPAEARPDLPAPASTAIRTQHSSSPWRSSWRRDSRYDWWRWRDRNRWLFNLGFYFDPFGWGYRRYPIGWRLWPSYYDMNYWLQDPWTYRLPPAYGPYRWVRYWDDALLVNIYTGQVVDVIHDFFW